MNKNLGTIQNTRIPQFNLYVYLWKIHESKICMQEDYRLHCIAEQVSFVLKVFL